MAAGADPYALLEHSFREIRLPPTPPEDHVDVRSPAIKTPPMEVNTSPPTPDWTPQGLRPPRPPLTHQHSSNAESFITAQEEVSREPSHEDLNAQVLSHELANGHGPKDGSAIAAEDDAEDDVEDERWREIPGAFRSTPSTTASSHRTARSKKYQDYENTPSTVSSKFARPKQYQGTESSPSTGSSHGAPRSKQYQHDAESPSERSRHFDQNDWEKHVSYMHSDDDWEGKGERKDESKGERKPGHDVENDLKDVHVNGHDCDGHDWEKHVSYIAFEAEGEPQIASESVREEPPSNGRLSGQGRRVGYSEDNGLRLKRSEEQQKANAVDHSGLESRKLQHRPLHKAGHLPDYNAPLPNVTVRKRRNLGPRTPEKTADTGQAREERRLSSLREQVETLASHRIPQEFLATPPRTSNDLVYKQIQQANMDRFDAMENAKAIGAVVIPTDEARNRSLRHISKQHSLRSVNGVSASSPITTNSHKVESPLRHKKAVLPQRGSLLGSPEHEKRRSVSGPVTHTLRHEKRPLSSLSRPNESQHSFTALPDPASSPKALQNSPLAERQTPKLRHSSLPIHVSKRASKMTTLTRNSIDAAQDHVHDHGLRRFARDYRLENNRHSLHEAFNDENDAPPDVNSPASSNFLAANGHQRNRSLKTPNSGSAWSDRTDMEVCEAQNIAIFPHSNDSVLVVHGSQPASKDKNNEPSKSGPTAEDSSTDDEQLRVPPLFSSNGAPLPPSIEINGKSIHAVESPLTNPRAPPAPPVIQFIPPTPAEEDDRQLTLEEAERRSLLERRPSLANRARRYSDIVVRPLLGRTLTNRTHVVRPSPAMAEKRDEKLHPNWVPNSFWQDEEDYWSDPEEPLEPLPAGGDTSEHPRSSFPRKMSVRMPGFRGTGGFLLGNSLGMDRHGTNRRRPHVNLRRHSNSGSLSDSALQHLASTESMRALAMAQAAPRTFSIPGTKTRVQFVGFKAFRERMEKIRESKELAIREKKRQEIRDQIGVHIVHNT